MTIAERLRADAHQKGKLAGIQEGMLAGKQIGMQEGIQTGKLEEALRIARTLLEKGLERDVVLSITGLSEKDL